MANNTMNENSEAVTNIEDAIQLIGGFGRFQLLMSFITMGNVIRAALTYYPLPYMDLFPVFMCTSDATDVPFECEAEQFCPAGSTVYYDFVQYDDEKTSLHNWVEQLDLKCKSNSEIGLIGTMYFVGVVLSVLIVPRMADLHGRKWPILIC